jgi:hypothetical protein
LSGVRVHGQKCSWAQLSIHNERETNRKKQMETALYEILALVTSVVGKANPVWFSSDEFDAWQEQVIDNAKIVVTTWQDKTADADNALDTIEALFTKVVRR